MIDGHQPTKNREIVMVRRDRNQSGAKDHSPESGEKALGEHTQHDCEDRFG